MDISLLFDLAKTITKGFDVVIEQNFDYEKIRSLQWKGRIWADVTNKKPLSKQSTSLSALIPIYPNSMEELLSLLFSKYRSGEFVEGFFLLTADFGHDWFTPVLLHPHIIIRIPRSQQISDQQRYLDPTQAHVLMYLGPKVSEFCTVFSPVGLVSGINTWFLLINKGLQS
jgi:hypothetical protein